MRLLIDGYNLLNASSIFAGGAPTLQRSRQALLEFLGKALNERLRRATIVAFDATFAPPGLPSEETFRSILVRFARRGQEADDLIEELIAEAIDPRNLLVVSSDHRIQRAARQKGASFVDSETWYRQLAAAKGKSRSGKSSPTGEPAEEKPTQVSPTDASRWLQEFGDLDAEPGALPIADRRKRKLTGKRSPALKKQPADGSQTEGESTNKPPDPATSALPLPTQSIKPSSSGPVHGDDKSLAAYNPFPPEYLADLSNLSDEELGPSRRKPGRRKK